MISCIRSRADARFAGEGAFAEEIQVRTETTGRLRMKLSRRQMVGGACIGGGLIAYSWLMVAEVVPTALELAASLDMPASTPVAWTGLTVAALLVAFGVDRAFSRES